jgi:hypothetical protein
MYHGLDGRIAKALRENFGGGGARVGVLFIGLALGEVVEREEHHCGRFNAVADLMLR